MKKLILLLALVTLVTSCTSYKNSITNPVNTEFVEEIAFNDNIDINKVTQKQFNLRYITKVK